MVGAHVLMRARDRARMYLLRHFYLVLLSRICDLQVVAGNYGILMTVVRDVGTSLKAFATP